MEIKDYITISSVIIIIVGWFINGYINRKHEIAKKRLEYRMDSLESFLKVWFFIQKNSNPFSDPIFLPLLEKARSNFQLYGETDEIDNFEKFIKKLETKDIIGANKALGELVPLVKNKIRKELGL